MHQSISRMIIIIFHRNAKKVWEVSISFSCQEKRTQSRCQNNLNIMLKAATDGEVITTTKPQTQVASNVAVFDVCNPAIGYHTTGMQTTTSFHIQIPS